MSMLTINDEHYEHLRALEQSLWKSETRFNRAYMDEILTSDFFEFGRSGRIYQRQETLDIPEQLIHAKSPLKDFLISSITQDSVLITYISEEMRHSLQCTNRSSIWINLDGKWKLRFHQGTPTDNTDSKNTHDLNRLTRKD